MRYLRTARARHLGYFGAPVNYTGLASSGAGIAGSAIASGTSVGSFAGPIGAAVGLATGLLITGLSSLNHPHGTCAPSAKTMADFLKCWSHAIPNDLMPVWTDMWGGSDGKGWVSCGGARNGMPPAAGCFNIPGSITTCVNGVLTRLDGQPTKGTFNCAPNGTVAFDRQAGYVSASVPPPPGSPGTSTAVGANSSTAATVAGIPTWLLAVAAGGLVLFVAMK